MLQSNEAFAEVGAMILALIYLIMEGILLRSMLSPLLFDMTCHYSGAAADDMESEEDDDD